jgi:hypothetical protein
MMVNGVDVDGRYRLDLECVLVGGGADWTRSRKGVSVK